MSTPVEHLHNTGVAVAELIDTTALGRATLRAGGAGLGGTVERVQWMEVLDDFADYLAAGDLLLTTAYNLGGDTDLQGRLARQMAASGVVAMVVKCGYYLDEIPYAVRRQANAIGLPVFELPREVPFVEISQSVYERLVSRSYARLRRGADIHRELVRLVVEGADLATIVRRAAALLGAPLVVQDAAGRRLAGARPQGGAAPPAPAAGRAAAALVVPVIARGVVHGQVALEGDGPWTQDDSQALEQVATVIALEIARSEQELRAERELVAGFVRELLAGGMDGAGAQRAAAVLGVQLPAELVVVRLHGRRRGEAGLVAVDESETVVITDEAGADRLEGPGGSASATGIEGLPDAFARAGRAWRLGEATAGGGGVHRYTDVETYDTLVGHLEGERLERLRARVTDPLPPPLLDTLRAYLGSAGSIAETARATYVHRNTVHYRVRRIEQLTGLDLSRLEDRLLCELALFAERVGG